MSDLLDYQYLDGDPSKPSLQEVPVPLAVLATRRQRTTYERFAKRPLDLAGAMVIGLLAIPVVAVVAVGVRLTMGKGVFYRQQRLGRNGRTFSIVKFRSMGHDRRFQLVDGWQGPERRLTHKTDDDPRHTGFGKFIRKFSLDELPQLWNVIKGDMSLVGPRPELPDVAARSGIVDHPRHLVRPGLTGPWQIECDRSTLIAENVHLDEAYVAKVTFRGDLRLLVKTPLMLLAHRGS